MFSLIILGFFAFILIAGAINAKKVEKEKVEKRKAHHERLQRQRIKQEELDKYRNNNPHYDIVDCVVSKIDNKTDLPFIYAEDDWIEV